MKIGHVIVSILDGIGTFFVKEKLAVRYAFIPVKYTGHSAYKLVVV